MIEPFRNDRGFPRAKACCSECGFETDVAADHRDPKAMESQVIKKLTAHGWSQVKKTLLCPSCTTSRKVIPMTKTADDLRQPSKAEKRQIMDLLNDAYDADAERYRGADTDDSVASVLGVMPAWVAEIREEFFGPAGGNESIDALVIEIAALRDDLSRRAADADALAKECRAALDRLTTAEAELKRIKAALAPRTLKKVGLQ